jgi:hypothetical protein
MLKDQVLGDFLKMSLAVLRHLSIIFGLWLQLLGMAKAKTCFPKPFEAHQDSCPTNPALGIKGIR